MGGRLGDEERKVRGFGVWRMCKLNVAGVCAR